MREDPRFLIDKYIFRIDTLFNRIIQIGNADNCISIGDLQENKHSYNLGIDPLNGKLLLKSLQDQKTVLIPKSVLDEGYLECSPFAQNFNANLSEKFGIRLVDKAVLKEMEDIVIPLPEQTFPIIEKDGHKLEIDVSLRELRNVDKPFVHIDLDRLEQKDGKYIVYINGEGMLSNWELENTTKMEIDQLVMIAPDDVSIVYGIPKENLPATDRELRSNPEFIRDRIEKGKLPVLRIVDEDYYVDTRLHELRSCNKFWKTIELIDNGYATELDSKHVYLFDYLNKKVIEDFNQLTEIPKHTVFIVFPDLESLDPVAAGRSICDNPYVFLDSYPLQPRMEARIVPIEKTFLAERIQYNKEKKQIEKSSKAKSMSEKKIVLKPPPKNNRNKGLSF